MPREWFSASRVTWCASFFSFPTIKAPTPEITIQLIWSRGWASVFFRRSLNDSNVQSVLRTTILECTVYPAVEFLRVCISSFI